VFQLLIAITLDPLKQSTQRLLLLLSEKCLLLFDCLLETEAHLIFVLLLLHLLALDLEQFCFFVAFHERQFFHFVLQFH